jgi:CRISPR/Cas system-associated exonuclease Cas4 (RecB family)
MNIEHISVSRGKTYKECKYLYKLKYHEKIPIPGEEKFHFTYGKIIHKIAEMYVEEKAGRSLGEISTDVLRGKVEYEEGKKAPALPDDYKKRMPGHLKSLQKITESTGTGGELEYKFRYDLDPPNEKFVTGFIDRLIIKEDPTTGEKHCWIIDYKTTKKGKWRETRESIVHDPQLRCYARVVNREFGVPAANIKCALYYLEGGDLLAAKYSQESLINIEKELLALYNEIAAADPERVWGNVGEHCNRCDYKDICPFVRKVDSWDGDMSSFNLPVI